MDLPQKLNQGCYVEVSLRGRNRPQAADAENFFRAAGYSSGEIVVFLQKPLFQVLVYLRSCKRVDELRKAYRHHRIPGVTMKLKLLKPGDWKEKWKRDYRPFSVGKFKIIPAWHAKRKSSSSKKILLRLDPKSVFGAGTHETTKLMLRQIGSMRGKFREFLDVGTGTGILSAAAFLSGADRIVAVDREKLAVSAALQNLRRNGCNAATVFRSELKNLSFSVPFDLLAANLFTNTHIKNRDKLISLVRPGKYLLLSGILNQHLPELRKHFAESRLKCLKIRKGRRWAMILYRRKRDKRDR